MAIRGQIAVSLPTELLRIEVPTRVLWGMADHALLPGLLDGLDSYVPNLQVRRVEGASHWIVHEQEPLVTQWLVEFLQSQ
jgi:pimeloyl-ACP methyl ester carboxylesterase